MCFSYSAPREIARGLKRIWYLKMGTPSSVSIIEDVDLDLKALEIVYQENGAAVEGLVDRNGHRKKELGKGKSVSWGGAQTKGKGREHELTKNMFFHSDFMKLCHKKNVISLSSSLTPLFFTIKKLAIRTNEIKDRLILTNHIVLYTCLTYVEPYQNILEHFCTKIQF